MLIVAFLAQQLALPAMSAHGPSRCHAGEDAAVSAAATCCAVPRPVNDKSIDVIDRSKSGGCTCVPSLCACETNHNPDPVAPERQNRSIEPIVAFLALPTGTLSELRKEARAIQSHDVAVVTGGTCRRLSMLCVWRT